MTRIVPGYTRGSIDCRPPNPTLHYEPGSKHRLDPPRIEYDEPYEAYFCQSMGFWRRKIKVQPETVRTRTEAAIPVHDASSVWWVVVDRRTKATLWRFRAGTFDVALAEKRRLCAIAGGKSGYCFLTQE